MLLYCIELPRTRVKTRSVSLQLVPIHVPWWDIPRLIKTASEPRRHEWDLASSVSHQPVRSASWTTRSMALELLSLKELSAPKKIQSGLQTPCILFLPGRGLEV